MRSECFKILRLGGASACSRRKRFFPLGRERPCRFFCDTERGKAASGSECGPVPGLAVCHRSHIFLRSPRRILVLGSLRL